AEEGKGLYGRVSKLNGTLYNVQYFLLMAWDETAYNGGFGNHEGDVICLTFDVDLSQMDKPRITAAVFSNHDRELFVEPSALDMPDGHVRVYLEKGTNEPWPNKGTRGYGGWPK